MSANARSTYRVMLPKKQNKVSSSFSYFLPMACPALYTGPAIQKPMISIKAASNIFIAQAMASGKYSVRSKLSKNSHGD